MKKQKTDEMKAFSLIRNPFQAIVYLFRFKTKELFGLVIILLLGWIISMNISCDKKNGLRWTPATKQLK